MQVEIRSECVLVAMDGDCEYWSWETAEQNANEICQTLQERRQLLVFDVGEVSYFGAVTLALLLRCHKTARQLQCELVLARVGKLARELLQITNLDTLWPIYDSVDDAIQAHSADA